MTVDLYVFSHLLKNTMEPVQKELFESTPTIRFGSKEITPIHWENIAWPNVAPSWEMLVSSGLVKNITCVLPGQSLRKGQGTARYVYFDKDYLAIWFVRILKRGKLWNRTSIRLIFELVLTQLELEGSEPLQEDEVV